MELPIHLQGKRFDDSIVKEHQRGLRRYFEIYSTNDPKALQIDNSFDHYTESSYYIALNEAMYILTGIDTFESFKNDPDEIKFRMGWAILNNYDKYIEYFPEEKKLYVRTIVI